MSDTVVTKYILDPSGYVSGAQKVKGATAQTGQATKQGEGFFKKLAGEMGGASSSMHLAGVAFKTASAVIGAAITALAIEAKLAFDAMEKAAKFESLENSIKAVEGSALRAKTSMMKLKEIAKAPGIGFEEAVKGYGGFRRAGLSSDFSFRAVAGAGKANAYSAGGKEEFGRVILAFTQIANKQYLQGDELLQLMEAGINVNQPLKAAYGTADTEELKKKGITSKMVLETLVKAFEKLPAVAGGAQNAFDNLSDAMQFAKVAVGGEFLKAFTPTIDSLSTALEKLTANGTFAAMAESVATSFDVMIGGTDNLESTMTTAAAGVMTFNQYMAGFIEGLKEAVKFLMNNPLVGGFISMAGGALKTINGLSIADQQAANIKALEDNAKIKKHQNEKDKKAMSALKPEAPQKDAGPAITFQQIAENTRKTAENTKSMQRHIMGGGDLARLGVTPVEMTKASKGGARRGSAKSVEQKIRDLVEELSYMHTINHANIQTGQKRAGAF